MQRILILTLAALLPQLAAAQTPKVKLDQLGWLAGCWKAKPNESRFNNVEQWMKPTGNVMLGLGAQLKGGKATSYEYMRIEAQDNGDLVYVAKPHNQKEASFTLTSDKPDVLVFENAKHDFPQKITYRLEKDGSMEMRIDGEVKGEKRAALFPVIKTPCE